MRYLLICVLLSGCGLSPNYAQESRDTELHGNALSCEKLGYARGTQANAECALRVYEVKRGASSVTVR